MGAKPTTKSRFKPGGIRTLLALGIVGAVVALPAIFIAMVPTDRSYPTAIEVHNLAAAIEQYRIMHKRYPPSFSDPALVAEHMHAVFPHNTDVVPQGLDAAEALVFWLTGFGDDPTRVMHGVRLPLFNFNQRRLRDTDGDGFFAYYPPSCDVPYVYLHHAAYETEHFAVSPTTGVARAYLTDQPGSVFANPQTFQIIAAGPDSHYGSGGRLPSGEGCSPQDLDNFTNFWEGRLGEKQ